ncbi:peptidoglycan editing factor PgeF [Bacillus sp. NEB1478]|uniref:peptidoglycan editing factor PgeF n=1 Tax=Bacillus sp. NEB1478 TaxID=3073816 RepID=UPI00287386D4|nr:peptidoglycan editing factor PgeF [Bacillus sp. NEB1478]WNB90475.1 peptidoglycan editing factor PgeF [Bacillus sp. NEB1478]
MNLFKQTGKQMSLQSWQNENPNILAGFTTRTGGFSTDSFQTLNMGFHVEDNPEKVQKNRLAFAEDIGFPIQNWVGTQQVHGTNIMKVTPQDIGKGSLDFESAIENTDGIYTEVENVLLTSLYADCVPLYFYSPENNLIGLAHAGWRGTVGKIGPKMVKLWCEKERVDIQDIKAAIGPAIGDCCYEVDEKVITEVRAAMGGREDNNVFSKNQSGKYQLNLQNLNEIFLINAGLSPENITKSHDCTSCKNDIFFSYRKENGKTGRMMSFIGRKHLV